MESNSFSIGDVMFMLDVMKEDKVRWDKKMGIDKDIIDEYDSIISKLESRLEAYHGMKRAVNSLLKQPT